MLHFIKHFNHIYNFKIKNRSEILTTKCTFQNLCISLFMFIYDKTHQTIKRVIGDFPICNLLFTLVTFKFWQF